MKQIKIVCLLASMFFMIGCNSQRQLVNNTTSSTTTSSNTGIDVNKDSKRQQLAFVEKVTDNAAYQKTISSKISFTLHKGDKNISVDGSINMERDEVIRIQLAPLGLVEVGRIEMRPNDVLILIRPTKEYIQATYDEIDFFRNNGLNFYSLQALFWNQLFIPNQQRVSQQMLETFQTELDDKASEIDVLLNDGSMKYRWTAERQTGRITQAKAVYEGHKYGTSSLVWQYSDFSAIGSKKFPLNNQLTLKTNDGKGKQSDITVNLRLKKIDTNSSFDKRTEVSSKYRKISVEQAILRIMSL